MNNFQEQLGKLLNLEQLQESVKEFYDQDALMKKMQDNVTLASKLIEANTAAASDAMIVQSVKLREGIESVLKQANTLAGCKDLEAAVAAQKEFGEQSKEALLEQAWMNIGLAVSALETNLDIIKSAAAKTEKQ